MQRLIKTFLDLAEIDEVHPDEFKVLTYVEQRLKAAKVAYTRDKMGNIVARIKGSSPDVLGLCGHVDIAAPLLGRKVVVTDKEIQTDGVALLGGDDKTAVAALLELATELHERKVTPAKSLELIFTVGEEAGLLGAKSLDLTKAKAKRILVLDWFGPVNNIVSDSPAYFKVDVSYKGKDAHPALWQQGINAGAVLMKAASQLHQGDYAKDVIFNIGVVRIGHARNKVPGHASLQAELRSYNTAAVRKAAEAVGAHFRKAAKADGVKPLITIEENSGSYRINKAGSLYREVAEVLGSMDLESKLESTYGCFDGNIFATRGRDVINLGAAYYNPHSPDEKVNIAEFIQLYDFLRRITGSKPK
jgi:tripeptide aminopeptidase